MEFLSFFAFILAVVALVIVNRRCGMLERELRRQHDLLQGLDAMMRRGMAPMPAPAPMPAAVQPPAASIANYVAHSPFANDPAPPPTAEAPPAPSPAAAEPPTGSPFDADGDAAADTPFAATAPQFQPEPQGPTKWDLLQERIKANWTGILGAAILVVGVAFFGVLASLYIGPAGRFAMILGFAGAVFTGSRWLARKDGWRDYAGWLVGVSGATALFACLGAGGIDGLKFIDAPLAGLAVLCAGIALNLAFAWLAGKENLAALHVVLSLLALAVAPAEPPVLLVGTVTALAGIGLSYKRRWDLNLLAILLAFALFHQVWAEKTPLDLLDARPFGLPCVLLVGLAAALVHYRKEYAAPRFEALPFVVHLLNWGVVALNVVRYASGSVYAVPALAVGAIAALLLARRARGLGVGWLYTTDSLVGQALALYAIVLLERVGVGPLDRALLVFLELAIFHVLCAMEGEARLTRILYPLEWLALVAVALCGLDAAQIDPAHGRAATWRLLVAAGAALAQTQLYARRRLPFDDPRFIANGEREPSGFVTSPLTFLAPALLLVAYGCVRTEPWAAALLAAALLGLHVLRVKSETPSLAAALVVTLGFAHALVFWRLFDLHEAAGGARQALMTGLPLLALDVVMALDRRASRAAVYLGALLTAALSYVTLQPLSDFAPGGAYLALSLVALELGVALRRKADTRGADEALLHAGYFFLALFGGRHVLVHLQSEASLGPVPIRLALALLGLGVLVYWLSYAPALEKATRSPASRALTPYLWETGLALLALTVAVELPAVWHPVAWVAVALGLFWFAKRRGWPERIAYYSWGFLVASAAQLAFVASTYATPGEAWHERAQYVGWIAILAQLGYVAVVWRTGGYPIRAAAAGERAGVAVPRGLGALGGGLFPWIQSHRSAAVFYPVITGLGIFLYWRFEHAVLTLLWVGEVFAVFGLGIVVREKHFIRVALAFLAFCVGRLIFFDLAQENLVTRAAVFVGVGVLMLGINALYRRFKDRIG